MLAPYSIAEKILYEKKGFQNLSSVGNCVSAFIFTNSFFAHGQIEPSFNINVMNAYHLLSSLIIAYYSLLSPIIFYHHLESQGPRY